MFRDIARAAVAALLLAGCANQLEKIEEETGGSGGGVPPAVATALKDSCAKVGCHVSGGAAPVLEGGALDGLIGSKYVTIGDIPASYLAVKMLPDNLVSALGATRTGARMPLDQDFLNPNNQVILAWIAGAEFEGGAVDTDTDPGTGTDTDPGTGTDTDTGTPAMPTFTNVDSMVFATCSCHRGPAGPANGNLSFPMGAMGHAAIVNVKSVQLPAMNLITPGDPAQSYLYLKVAGGFLEAGGAGDPMPLGGMVGEAELMLLEEWITAGAMND